jgi:4-hydroxy-2-oxoheptanedioate aldolase
MKTQLRQAVENGGVAYGAWLFLREPLVAEAASKAGYDYVCIDMQHGLCGFDLLPSMLLAVGTGPATALVRVPENDSWLIGRALDAGAMGVIVPMVNNAQQAAAAVAACRYAPLGQRSIGPIGAMTRYPRYVETANQDVLCIPMIETAEAVGNLASILAVPGVDAVYIGPADLSLTLGLRPGIDQPDASFQNALAAVVDGCAERGIISGLHASAQIAGQRRAAGFQMITVAYDLMPITTALLADLETARKES